MYVCSAFFLVWFVFSYVFADEVFRNHVCERLNRTQYESPTFALMLLTPASKTTTKNPTFLLFLPGL